MVGLSVVLEAQNQKGGGGVSKETPQVISKISMMINKPSSFLASSSSSSSFPVPSFLEHCFLCGQKLLPGKDIYMYKGDRAFCSVDCRCRQIFMDEEEAVRKENFSLAATKLPTSASSSPSSSASRHSKSSRNRAGGGFVY